MKTIYKDFDLPRQHLYGSEWDFIPPKARDSSEIERRHDLQTGELLGEFEQRGIRMAEHVLTSLIDEDPRELAFAGDMLAMASLNSSWYRYAAHAPDVTRRRLKLPILRDQMGRVATRRDLYQVATHRLQQAGQAYDVVRVAATSRSHQELSMWLANQNLGNAALDLVAINTEFSGVSRRDLQYEMREASLGLLGRSRIEGVRIGAHPSLAQLADPDSPLAVHWRRQAPAAAYQALEQATEEVDWRFTSSAE